MTFVVRRGRAVPGAGTMVRAVAATWAVMALLLLAGFLGSTMDPVPEDVAPACLVGAVVLALLSWRWVTATTAWLFWWYVRWLHHLVRRFELPVGARRPRHHAASTTLYLRSFAADEVVASLGLMNFRTSEETLAATLNPLGQLVAVEQRPLLPLAGAVRLRATNGDWRPRVLHLLRSAGLVVVAAGTTDSLLWELAQAVTGQLVAPQRLIVVVVGGAEHYRAFRDRSEHLFPRGLPDFVPGRPSVETGFRGMVLFDAHWVGRFVRLDCRQPGDPLLLPTPRTYAIYRMGDVYRELAIRWPIRRIGIPGRRPLVALTDAQVTILLGLFVVFPVLLMIPGP